jgi:hypothetical protein
MDSVGTAEAVVTVSERVALRAAASFGMSRNWTADGTRCVWLSGFPRCDRLLPRLPSRSDTRPRDDVLADRHDAIYRGGVLPRVREVA